MAVWIKREIVEVTKTHNEKVIFREFDIHRTMNAEGQSEAVGIRSNKRV